MQHQRPQKVTRHPALQTLKSPIVATTGHVVSTNRLTATKRATTMTAMRKTITRNIGDRIEGHLAGLMLGNIEAERGILGKGEELQISLTAAADSAKGVAMHVRLSEENLEPYSFEPAEDLSNGAWRLANPPLFNHVKMTADRDAGVSVETVAETDEQSASAKNRSPSALMSQPECRGNHVSNPLIL